MERDAVLFLCENKMRPGGAQVPMASHMARLPKQRHNRYLGTFQVAPLPALHGRKWRQYLALALALRRGG